MLEVSPGFLVGRVITNSGRLHRHIWSSSQSCQSWIRRNRLPFLCREEKSVFVGSVLTVMLAVWAGRFHFFPTMHVPILPWFGGETHFSHAELVQGFFGTLLSPDLVWGREVQNAAQTEMENPWICMPRWAWIAQERAALSLCKEEGFELFWEVQAFTH